MYKHILIATDGSILATKAVASGLQLAKALGAQVTAITATNPWTSFAADVPPAFDFPIDEYQKAAEANAAGVLSAVRTRARELGVECDTLQANSYPADAILETAKSKGCDLIVMASHGRRGIARALLGSQAASVVASSPVPVLICK
jgi:nucleotide-binding universal stress UspA family protein